MSRNTKHLTSEQRAALTCQAHCIRQSRLADTHWRIAAPYFRKMLEERLYTTLDFDNFSQWCESIHVSPGHAYALAQLAALPSDIQNSLCKENCGLGNIKIILAPLSDAIESQDDDSIAELIEDAARMTWHDLRQKIHGDDPQPKYIIVVCPKCNRELKASRAVRLELK